MIRLTVVGILCRCCTWLTTILSGRICSRLLCCPGMIFFFNLVTHFIVFLPFFIAIDSFLIGVLVVFFSTFRIIIFIVSFTILIACCRLRLSSSGCGSIWTCWPRLLLLLRCTLCFLFFTCLSILFDYCIVHSEYPALSTCLAILILRLLFSLAAHCIRR